MGILALISQEVKEIFSPLVSDASVSLETLEAEVLRASRELGVKRLWSRWRVASVGEFCVGFASISVM